MGLSEFDPSTATPVENASPSAFDPNTATPVSDAPTPTEDTARVTGLGTRALVKGVGELHDMPQHVLDAIDTMSDSASNYVRGKLGLAPKAPEKQQDYGPSATSLLERGSDAAGLPKPETPEERIGSAAVSALPSAVLAPEAPAAGVIGNMLGGAGAQTAKEAGASPLVQAGAGLVAGSVPALGSVGSGLARGLVRGGEQGRQAMESRLADASQSGADLTAGQAGGSKLVQYLEGTLSKLWGGGPIKKAADQQSGAMGDSVNKIVDNLSGGTQVSPTAAGKSIVAGIGDKDTPGTAFGKMHAAEKSAYDNLDNLVHPNTPIDMSATLAKLESLAAPDPGAAKTTAALKSSQISSMRNNLRSDLQASQAPGGEAARPVFVAGGEQPELPAGSIPYSSARALRSDVGNSIDWGFAPSDPTTNAGLKQVYGALSQDLKTGASAVSPEAASAAEHANSLYTANQAKRDSLSPYLDKAGGPEAVYTAATNGTKSGATKINDVMSALPPEHQNIVRATVLSRLGKAAPSANNAEGSEFSANTFLTNWSKLDPDAKDALFGASGNSADLRGSLDSLAGTASNIREGTKLRNFSGSGEAVGHGAGLFAAWEGIKHLIAGHPMALAGAAGGVAANNLLSRALTNPTTVRWLAQATKAPKGQLPNLVNQLNNSTDPDAQDLGNYLTSPESSRQSRASGGKVDHQSLVDKLIQRWKSAKKATDATTKPLLNLPDAAIVKALDIAGKSI